MTSPAQPLATRDLGPAPEPEVVRDLVVKGLKVAPVVLVVGAVGWGVAGAVGVALGLALVLVNFSAAAALQAWAARISLGLVMGTALFGFAIRMALVALVVLLVRGQSWVATVPLGLTLVLGHLGLLLWETRFVSASLAFPGLKPAPKE